MWQLGSKIGIGFREDKEKVNSFPSSLGYLLNMGLRRQEALETEDIRLALIKATGDRLARYPSMLL